MNTPCHLQQLSILEKSSAAAAALLPPPTPTPLINRTMEEKTGKLAEAILIFCCCLFVCCRGVRSILLHPFCGSCFCTIGRAQTEMNPATTHLCAWIFCMFFWVELSTCAHFCIFACIFCLHAWCLEACKTLGFMLLFIRAHKSSIFAQQIFTVLDDHTAAISPGLFLHSSASLKEMLETDRLIEKM